MKRSSGAASTEREPAFAVPAKERVVVLALRAAIGPGNPNDLITDCREKPHARIHGSASPGRWFALEIGAGRRASLSQIARKSGLLHSPSSAAMVDFGPARPDAKAEKLRKPGAAGRPKRSFPRGKLSRFSRFVRRERICGGRMSIKRKTRTNGPLVQGPGPRAVPAGRRRRGSDAAGAPTAWVVEERTCQRDSGGC